MTDFVADADAAVRAGWAARAAGWNRAAPETVSPADGYNQRMIAAAGIEPGGRVLDIASGTGDPAISIAVTVGADGWVVATDGSPEMLAGARRRAANMELAQMDFAINDMTALPFADASFNAVTCRFGIMFPLNAVGAATEARRVLRPGGKAAYFVHGGYDDNVLFKLVRETTLAYLDREIPDKPGQRYRFAEPGAISRVLSAAGFEEVEETEFRDTSKTPADKPFWHTALDRSHGDDLAKLTAPERAALDERMRAAFEPYLEDGVYLLQSHVRMGAGRAA